MSEERIVNIGVNGFMAVLVLIRVLIIEMLGLMMDNIAVCMLLKLLIEVTHLRLNGMVQKQIPCLLNLLHCMQFHKHK